ncbi:MAG: hypothetical protein HGB08_04555 [Candidatus Moranbacteria bacterium]|nr:hypothetical protein [Candidatus Moranbacteria bacterium]
MTDEYQELIKSISDLEKQIGSSNSLRKNFLRGIFIGIGSAIGASVIAAIAITTLAKIFHSIKDVPGILK